jgi:SagB-type dehydrogenase family enzyme
MFPKPSEMHEFLPVWNNYVDPAMHRSVVEFHSKGNWIRSSEIPLGGTRGISQESIESATFSQLKPAPQYSRLVPLEKSEMPDIARDFGTTHQFASEPDFSRELLSKLLLNSFAAYASGERAGHRPYPSAGGLYPVEFFVVINRTGHHSIPPGAYHYLPVDHALGAWSYGCLECGTTVLGYQDACHPPPVSLVYLLNLHKALFKYQYRGYRHGLMEVGSMYQQAKKEAEKLSLASHCWSNFSDDRISRWLGLHPEHYLPVLVQSFGWRRENNHGR